MDVVLLMILAFYRTTHSMKFVALILAHPAGDNHYYLKFVYNLSKEYHDDILLQYTTLSYKIIALYKDTVT